MIVKLKIGMGKAGLGSVHDLALAYIRYLSQNSYMMQVNLELEIGMSEKCQVGLLGY